MTIQVKHHLFTCCDEHTRNRYFSIRPIVNASRLNGDASCDFSVSEQHLLYMYVHFYFFLERLFREFRTVLLLIDHGLGPVQAVTSVPSINYTFRLRSVQCAREMRHRLLANFRRSTKVGSFTNATIQIWAGGTKTASFQHLLFFVLGDIVTTSVASYP